MEEDKDFFITGVGRRCVICDFFNKKRCLCTHPENKGPVNHGRLCTCPKNVPNDVYRFRVTLDLEDPEVTVYTDEGAFDSDEDKVKEAYFTKDKIEELKYNLIEKIMQSKNPFDIYCVDEDGGYIVSDDEIFRGNDK